jgi:hypothetical protein
MGCGLVGKLLRESCGFVQNNLKLKLMFTMLRYIHNISFGGDSFLKSKNCS